MPSSPSRYVHTLLPCPCCGYRAEIEQVPHDPEGPNSGGYYIECKHVGCGITTRLAFAAMDDPVPGLVESWNRRHASERKAIPAEVADMLEALQDYQQDSPSGAWCRVSRQAVDEAVALIKARYA